MTNLLLPRGTAAAIRAQKEAAAARNISGSRAYELQSDEFVGPAAVAAQLKQLMAYVEDRREKDPAYNLPYPSGWKILVLMLTLPEETSGGLRMIDEAREMKAVTSPQGVVLALGPACYTDPKRFLVNDELLRWHEPGDRITWVKYDAHLFKLANGQVLGFLTDTQPVGLIDSGWEVPQWK